MSILIAARFDAHERRIWRDALHAALPQESLFESREAAAGEPIDVAIVADPPPGALQGLSGLRLVQSLWAGVETLLADPTLPASVPLARMVDPLMSEAMAQSVLWAVLGLHRGYFACARQQRQARWQPLPQRRADEVAVTVLGLGRMGALSAARLAAAGYRVSGWSARGTPVPGVRTLHGEAALAPALAQAQIVVNLLPLTPRTRGLFDARTLACLPHGAALVNFARGAHVVESDLLHALDTGAIAHAVLDVFAIEPLPVSHPFWAHPSVTVLPHMAAQTDPRSAARVAARNVQALREGRPIEDLVDRARGY